MAGTKSDAPRGVIRLMKIVKQYLPYLILIGLLAAASLLLGLVGDVKVSDDLAVRLELPARFAGWAGEDVFFCRNEQCLRSFTADELKGSNTCLSCGKTVVKTWSLAEENLLPPDTVLLKKRYQNESGAIIMATVVVAGSEITSIHRPQMCLVGQGHRIMAQKTMVVPLDGRNSLSIKVLNLLYRRSGKEAVADQSSVFAYWYAGGGRETSSNFTRSFYMLVDRILLGRTSRWAYVSAAAAGSDTAEKEILAFIQAFYPTITN